LSFFDKCPEIRFSNNLNFCMVGLDEISRNVHFGFRIPFEFKTGNCSIRFFYIINFLLLFCPPKIPVTIVIVVMISLEPFGHQEIFPQCSGIIAQSNRIEILNNRIAHTIIIKINLSIRLDFITKITAERS